MVAIVKRYKNFDHYRSFICVEERIAATCDDISCQIVYDRIVRLGQTLDFEETEASDIQIAKGLPIGPNRVRECLDELETKARVIKIYKRKNGLIKLIKFRFDFKGSTITASTRSISETAHLTTETIPAQNDRFSTEVVAPSERVGTTSEESRPFLIGDLEKEHMDALCKRVTNHFDQLNTKRGVYGKFMSNHLGVSFLSELIDLHPHKNGAEMRSKYLDESKLNIFKTIYTFRQEGSQTPNGTILQHERTGEVGTWEWSGKIGRVRLEDGQVINIDSLGRFRAWFAIGPDDATKGLDESYLPDCFNQSFEAKY